jgi:hypothetical protein
MVFLVIVYRIINVWLMVFLVIVYRIIKGVWLLGPPHPMGNDPCNGFFSHQNLSSGAI